MRNTYLSFNKAKFNHLFNSLRNSILLLSVGITLSGCTFFDIEKKIEDYFEKYWLVSIFAIVFIGFLLTLGHLLALQFVKYLKITWGYIKSYLCETDDEKK